MLGRSVGRLDWWNIRDEHTPFQWQCQKTMFLVDPFGEIRDDMRAAVNTANLIAAQAAEPVNADQFSEMVNTLANYCEKSVDPTAVEFNPSALAKITGAK